MPYKNPEDLKAARQRYAIKNQEKKNTVTRKNRASKQRFLNAVKSFSCLDCGNYWPPCAMELDHTDSTNKVESVSRILRAKSWAKLCEEIMKCDLVCACCHAIRTQDRYHLPS